MEADAQAISTVERIQEKRINDQELEIERLKRALRVLVGNSAGVTDDERSVEDGDVEMASKDDDSSPDEDALPIAIWDAADLMFRCTLCTWEIIDGACHACGVLHEVIVKYQDLHDEGYRSVCTDDEALRSDRRLVPRSTTPLIDPIWFTEEVPEEYATNPAEYLRLLRRGATRRMCEKFHLEYSSALGIVAWADDDIFETFSGPRMQPGHFWKIHLGRYIELERNDPDGSRFIDELLEEVLYAPLVTEFSRRSAERWETVESSPGIWATLPMQWAENEQDDDDDQHKYEEMKSSQSDEDYELARNLEAGDNALDPANHGLADNSVIRPDDYEPTEADDEEIDMNEPRGWDWSAYVTKMSDVEYDPTEYDGESGAAEQVEGDTDVQAITGTMRSMGVQTDDTELELVDDEDGMSTDSDRVGSDWDSEEVLSGDEEVLGMRKGAT